MKRPDFEIIMKDIGSILVDVKSQTLSADFENFTLDETELQKLLSFQTISRAFVWFVIGCPENRYNTWYWISLNDVFNKGLIRARKSDSKPFRTISIQDCITVGWNDGLEKLVKS